MAWTASITQKGIVDKTFQVNVSYTNGSLQFNEIMDMTGGSVQTLSDRITNRLATLETTQTLIPLITVGAFTPSSTPLTNFQIFQNAFRHYNSCQRAVALGLLQDTDPLFTSATTSLQNAWDPSFVDQL